MAIDTNMYGNLGRPSVQLENPMDAYAKVAQMQQMQNQNRLADLTLAQHQRTLASDNALASLLGAGKSGADVVSGLGQQGYGNAALDYQKKYQEGKKSAADVEKTAAETKKIDQETAANQFELAGQLASAWAKDPAITVPQIQAGLNTALNSKIISPEVYQAKITELQSVPPDSASLNKWAQGTLAQVMKAKDSMSYIAPDANTLANNKTSRENNAETNATSRENNARSVAATVLGIKTADARARERLAFDQSQPKGQYDAERGVLVDPRTGIATPVKSSDGQLLGAKDKPLTESQSNATSFAARMRQASEVIDKLEEKGVNPGKLGTILAGSNWTNPLASSEGQQYMQGQRNWVSANLRKESGAAIPDSEMANEIKKYFPQPGDSKEVIAQKRQARAVAEEGMMVQAGPGAKQVPGIIDRTRPKSSKAAGGIKFLGFE
jgi:hypothetical protein